MEKTRTLIKKHEQQWCSCLLLNLKVVEEEVQSLSGFCTRDLWFCRNWYWFDLFTCYLFVSALTGSNQTEKETSNIQHIIKTGHSTLYIKWHISMITKKKQQCVEKWNGVPTNNNFSGELRYCWSFCFGFPTEMLFLMFWDCCFGLWCFWEKDW